jgi:hypothetical protein
MMNANSNTPQIAPERLEQMINLALSHAQESKIAARQHAALSILNWFRAPLLVPIPVRALMVAAFLALIAFQMIPAPQTAAPNQIADTDAYSDVSDYMLLDLLDQLS